MGSPLPEHWTLPKVYRGLWGDDLLARLREDRRADILEALWRVGDAEVAGRVAPHLAASGVAELADLLVQEVTDSKLSETGAEPRVVAAISDYMPPLTAEGTRTLAQRLRDEEPLDGDYEEARPLLERWMLGQTGDTAAVFATEVVRRETTCSSDPSVGRAALARLAQAPELVPVLAELREALETDGDEAWERATEAISALSAETQARKADEFHALVTAAIRATPEHYEAPHLDAALEEAFAAEGYSTLKELIEGDELEPVPGSAALLRTAERVPHSVRRRSLFAAAVVRQTELYRELVGDIAPEWSAEEWRERLERLRKLAGEVPAEFLAAVLGLAPVECSSLVVELAARHPSDDASLLAAASAKLAERCQALGGHDELSLDAVWWPVGAAGREVARVAEIVEGALEANYAVTLCVSAYREKRIDAEIAARLIPSAGCESALEALPPGHRRRALSAAVYATHPAQAAACVRALQEASFSLDLAEALAVTAPEAAFAGADQAWTELDDKAQARLLALLARHSTHQQLPLLSAIAADTSKENRERRGKAALRVAELLGEGTAPPEYILELLSSNTPALRQDGVVAIGTMKPRDAGVLDRLHETAKEKGPAGKAAGEVLAGLGQVYENDLRAAGSVEAAVQALALVGRAAQPGSVSILLQYLGPDALDENLQIRRAAAVGVVEACKRSTPSLADQERLVELLDGSEPEVDPEARRGLADALNLAVLGEDKALADLYAIVGYEPRTKRPDDLFGEEKGPLARQLQLFQQADARGAQGRGYAIAHLDLAAEALVRVAYLRYGESEDIKNRIQNGERKDVRYGELIQALASVKELKGVQGQLLALHELRGERSEVTHAGPPATEDEFVAARESFRKSAERCLRVLDKAAAEAR